MVGDTGVIGAAHAAGLVVHGFTFRNDSSLYGFSDPIDEYMTYYALGIDGVFSDFPDTALQAKFERLIELVSDVSIGGRGGAGIRRSLVQKLTQAQRQVSSGRLRSAVGLLGAFSHEVQGLADTITPDDRQQFIDSANELLATLAK